MHHRDMRTPQERETHWESVDYVTGNTFFPREYYVAISSTLPVTRHIRIRRIRTEEGESSRAASEGPCLQAARTRSTRDVQITSDDNRACPAARLRSLSMPGATVA
jgi:hypothetical protein